MPAVDLGTVAMLAESSIVMDSVADVPLGVVAMLGDSSTTMDVAAAVSLGAAMLAESAIAMDAVADVPLSVGILVETFFTAVLDAVQSASRTTTAVVRQVANYTPSLMIRPVAAPSDTVVSAQKMKIPRSIYEYNPLLVKQKS